MTPRQPAMSTVPMPGSMSGLELRLVVLSSVSKETEEQTMCSEIFIRTRKGES